MPGALQSGVVSLFGFALGTPFQGGIFAIAVAFFALYIRREVSLRKLSVEAQQVEVNAQTAEYADRADRRDHFAEEMAALRDNIKDLRKELHDTERDCRQELLAQQMQFRKALEQSDRRHEECEVARVALREELTEMHEEIAGLRVQVRMASTDRLVVLGDKATPHSKAAGERVKKIDEGNGE
jgi:predicted  nucleic acid-binding Zn-ribbon protein